MVLRRPERSVECSDSEKKMSACADQNHAPSLTCVRLENEQIKLWFQIMNIQVSESNFFVNAENHPK
ncbi:hypothetical protein DXB15_00645 [Roseburia sp. OM02-15]|nr:hypothetical protein DXB15_00645 [Roseburia sp. OM02-15]